jgi:DNA polymerase III delta prime subunit
MSVTNYLLWEKYRPRTFDDLILLPRIRKQFEAGINQHYILYGHYGTGKTSLARILIGRYSKKTPFLEINCSEDTSIEVLRNEIQNFCKVVPMMESEYDTKYVFLDEFERVSPQFQDAFKAFIEKYNNNVRFILNTNHINKIIDGLKSRIKMINFDCQNVEEERYLKQEIYKRITNMILPNEGRESTKEHLVSIINKTFPDFRSTLVELQDYLQVGSIDNDLTNTTSNKVRLELYNILYDKNIDYEGVYHFLMTTFGADKIHIMIKLLGKPFIDWSISEKKSVDKLFECNYIISKYTPMLETDTDPIVLGMTIIGKLRDIL